MPLRPLSGVLESWRAVDLFKKSTVHAITLLDPQPLVFLAVDTPRRDPKDIHFVNPADGTPETFIQTRKIY